MTYIVPHTVIWLVHELNLHLSSSSPAVSMSRSLRYFCLWMMHSHVFGFQIWFVKWLNCNQDENKWQLKVVLELFTTSHGLHISRLTLLKGNKLECLLYMKTNELINLIKSLCHLLFQKSRTIVQSKYVIVSSFEMFLLSTGSAEMLWYALLQAVYHHNVVSAKPYFLYKCEETVRNYVICTNTKPQQKHPGKLSVHACTCTSRRELAEWHFY